MESICKHTHSLYLTACWPSHSPQTFDQSSQRWTDENNHIGAKLLNNTMYFSPAQRFADIWLTMHVCVCVSASMCVCILWRLYLVGNPSKLIIISKHDRVDKMSCAPPEPLSHHKPYLRWWTDVALAWTHQSLSVRVGVHLQARTDAPEHTHTSKASHMWALRRSKHTLELPLTWILYLRPLNICNAHWARAR